MDVITYETASGRDYIYDFLETLKQDKPKLRAKFIRAIEILEEFGIKTTEPVSKKLESGIFEVKATVGKDTARILYFFHNDKIILTHGFIKKTQKTPRSEIEKALKYRQEYILRFPKK